MRHFYPILAIILCIDFATTAQTSSIDNYVQYVDSLYGEKFLVQKKYKPMSFCGGTLTGYYLNKNLVFIQTVSSGEIGFIDTKWYIKDGILQKAIEYNFPRTTISEQFQYCKMHKDKNGHCDYLSLNSEHEKIIFYFLPSPKVSKTKNMKSISLTKTEQDRISQEFQECFGHLKNELK